MLFRSLDVSGKLMFFTNYQSDKAKQIEANPNVSLCFFWPHLERQVRLNGQAKKTSRQQSQEYFHNRPRESQLGAHASGQSAVIASREILDNGFHEIESQFAGTDVACPEHWGGYEIEPERIEFWQVRTGRLHDRICYRQVAEGWEIVRLAP